MSDARLAALLVLLAALTTACGRDRGPMELLNGSPNVTTSTVEDVIAFVNGIHSVNLDGYTVTIVDTLQDATKACKTTSVLGCHYESRREVYSAWLGHGDNPAYRQEDLDAQGAVTLAHELGHVYYLETTGDSDEYHTHSEWFHDEGSVCALAAAQFRWVSDQ